MNSNKLLSSLCYFSVLFAPFLFPIIVYFVTNDEVVKGHVKKALLSHLIPFGTVLVLGVLAIGSAFWNADTVPVWFFAGIALSGIVNIVVVIWNIIKGIKVLQEE
ncbi:uncharacterized protein DUF4870 [Thermolongibacillus altinsuensis]|uniref:Uncharacterized protein DUF4870 n=1 Tax=Thermolongibacillus altinsuensis TaxID=575256 RepID=A0A4R1QKH9_9BACL|nr:DUF4870 domain-containing protein [Thermolongibacillus altinsuensis]TCL47709.1 uncharacterized protein DUF4870 [Thermolongibacillus altinsuensis]